MTDSPPPADPGIRRPREALRDPRAAAEADEVATTDPEVLAGYVARSALHRAASSTPPPNVPRIPAGGHDPYSIGDDPTELARLVPRRQRY